MISPADQFLPPIGIDAEEILLPSDSVFGAACQEHAQKHMQMIGGQLGETALTFSKSCGLIWRADYICGDDFGPLVNRVMCWQRPTDQAIQIAIAVRQNTPALKDALRDRKPENAPQ